MRHDQKPQSWSECDEDVKDFVNQLVVELESALSNNFVGVYLFGSLAMGSYYRPKSDIDMIVVVKNKMSTVNRKEVTEMMAKHSLQRPSTGDIEVSILLLETAQSIPTPTPLEAHYDSAWRDKILYEDINYVEERFDTDLHTYLEYIKQRGIVLSGPPINEVFGDVSWILFIESVLDDFNWIIENEHILETPFYGVLNICRVLQLVNENNQKVHSKDEGGEWALQNLPTQYHPIIMNALDAYRSSKEVDESQRRTNGEEWDKEKLLAFRDFAIEQSITIKSH